MASAQPGPDARWARVVGAAEASPATAAQRQAIGFIDASPRAAGQRQAAATLSPAVPATAPVQRAVWLSGQRMRREQLFEDSDARRQLDAAIEGAASQQGVGRNDVRYQVLKMVEANEDLRFDSVSALAAAAAQRVADMLIEAQAADPGAGQENWLVFGMDGRNPAQVEQAVRIGYRNFDCAESYGTTELLAQSIERSLINRRQFKITYKFSLHESETAPALQDRLRGVAQGFGGYVDALIVHNLDAPDAAIKAAWHAMQGLKTQGCARQVGLGNLQASHAPLLEALQRDGSVDVVENALSSVLESEELRALITKSQARLLYYDVVKTAREIGIDSLQGIKDLMSAVAMQVQGVETQMILSSGKVTRMIENFKALGAGADREANWDEPGKLERIGTIYKWQQQRAAVADNDLGFALDPGVRGWLQRIAEAGMAETLRRQVNEAVGGSEQATPVAVRQWLHRGTPLSESVQDSVKVPARSGLKRRYLGMPLGQVMAALLGAKNCDWKWSIELVQMMVIDAGDWDNFGRGAMDQIASSA